MIVTAPDEGSSNMWLDYQMSPHDPPPLPHPQNRRNENEPVYEEGGPISFTQFLCSGSQPTKMRAGAVGTVGAPYSEAVPPVQADQCPSEPA